MLVISEEGVVGRRRERVLILVVEVGGSGFVFDLGGFGEVLDIVVVYDRSSLLNEEAPATSPNLKSRLCI